MRKIMILGLLLTSVSFVEAQNLLLQNPASAYVKFLGYKSEMITDSSGNQQRVCVFPDGTKCDEWLFFRGICGKDFSYCAIKGCSTETVVDSVNHSIYAVCVQKDSLGCYKKIPLLDFMKQNGDALFPEEIKKRKEAH